MNSRRDFIKKAGLLSGGIGFMNALPASVQKALAIDPLKGSTWLDAEHIVLLMQENRSFDHCFGTLQGVRGFNDPRAITLPDNNKVWLQTNDKGETYAPFRLNIKDTKATWMSSLPHSWDNQVQARNGGRYNQWLDAKKGGYPDIPMTMGYYTREDLPFYYAMADAFTICDHNFCSSLTGTTPNRLFFWTGTIREDAYSKARVYNGDTDYGAEAAWKTFPERLHENNISWKIYQNELSVAGGFTEEEDRWLSNFTDNPLEWFNQYKVKLSAGYIKFLQNGEPFLQKQKEAIEKEISALNGKERKNAEQKLTDIGNAIIQLKKDKEMYTQAAYEKLADFQKEIHDRAFTTNINDSQYNQLTQIEYDWGGEKRTLSVPKGDVLHQFRADVQQGKLPTVSWLVAPENYCDHPGAPWYGAWYISEVMDILTQNPDVWKKTIFIITYDENDGSFDHLPPFIPPHPQNRKTGLVTDDIDTALDYVNNGLDKAHLDIDNPVHGPIGLGYRVPMLIASPWSRGGFVSSEVFDHTSTLQFLETFLNKKYGKQIFETNISTWRRAVCGDLTSVFRTFNDEKTKPAVADKKAFHEGVNNARFKGLPDNYKNLTAAEIAQVNNQPASSPYMPVQEKGIRPACQIPYELYADGYLSADKKSFSINFETGNTVFDKRSVGAPFHVYAPGNHASAYGYEKAKSWSYGLGAGKKLEDKWDIADFENGQYLLTVYGPNGFFRSFNGTADDPAIALQCKYEFDKATHKPTGNVLLHIANTDTQDQRILISDNSYNSGAKTKLIKAGASASVSIDLTTSYNWYDFTVTVEGNSTFKKQYAGHVETGNTSFTDPLMARV